MSCNFRHELRVLHSLPLVADRRVCLQSVLGGSEKFRLFFDGEDGSFFVFLSYFIDLIRDGSVSLGSGISGNRLGGSVWVVRKQDVRHRDRDRRECSGHPAITIAFGRALVAEVEAKLQYLKGEMGRLFGNTANTFAGTEFPPHTTDIQLIQDGLKARGLLALPPGNMGFDPALLEAERDELMRACEPGPRDDFLMYDMGESVPKDEEEEATDAEESDEAAEPAPTNASGEEPPTSGGDASPTEAEEDQETRKRWEMSAMWAADHREQAATHDRERQKVWAERELARKSAKPSR